MLGDDELRRPRAWGRTRPRRLCHRATGDPPGAPSCNCQPPTTFTSQSLFLLTPPGWHAFDCLAGCAHRRENPDPREGRAHLHARGRHPAAAAPSLHLHLLLQLKVRPGRHHRQQLVANWRLYPALIVMCILRCFQHRFLLWGDGRRRRPMHPSRVHGWRHA